jgi:hypothetical protein
LVRTARAPVWEIFKEVTMSEEAYKSGQTDANKGWQPSPPQPSKTAEENNAYINGWREQTKINEQKK